MKNWEQEQAWDDYKAITKNYEDIVTLKNKLIKQLVEWVTEETDKYNDHLNRLMPLIKDRLTEELDLKTGKASEELREIPKEDECLSNN
jgi:Zn-dependent M32 family carboxypeptidase